MTDPSPYQPPEFPIHPVIPMEKKYSPIGAVIAWIVIVIGVGFIVVSVMKPQLKGKSTHAADNMETMNADLTVRLTIGEFHAFKKWGVLQPLMKDKLVAQVRTPSLRTATG